MQTGTASGGAVETALMHFEAESSGDDILNDFNHQPSKERNES